MAAAVRTSRRPRRLLRALRAPVTTWRRSLQLRVVAISVLLSALALAGVGTVVSFSIERGLFNDRLQQVVGESARATSDAQGVLQSATSYDSGTLANLQLQAIDVALETASDVNAGDGGYVMSPVEVGGTSAAQTFGPQPSWTSPRILNAISNDLTQAVAATPSGQRWQSVALQNPSTGEVDPGIAVGQQVVVPGVGPYAMYLVYDISDVRTTLDFVQRTLLIGGAALVLLIGAVTLLVVRLVVLPIRQAAAVSEQLAAGHLEVRIPERGEDVVATLARSYNRMADSLERQITQLADLSLVQQRFVSDVSHELRTPLTTIRLASDVLHDGRVRLDPPMARSTELLRTQVQRFEALLADLLEISRMDARAAEVAVEPTDLVALAREAVDALGQLAAESGSPVRLDAPREPVVVEVEPRRIARILRNLLANALEHGEGRPITVTIAADAVAVGIGVRDRGVGLSPADAKRVFDRFWRADPSRRRRIGGTGLGLAISLEDALLHGGALELFSRPTQGTNFVLTLPSVPGVPADSRPVPLAFTADRAVARL